jgi:Fe-S-cluster containining protein
MTLADSATWLREFYRRFDVETKLLYDREPFWRICQKCPDGYCCSRSSYVAVNRAGNPFLVEDWLLMLEFVQEHFSVADKKRLASNILSHRRDCIFLFGNRCSIHPARPWTSRIHPYTVSFYPNQDLFIVGEMAVPSCPALAPLFGLKKDQEYVQSLQIIASDEKSHLVQVKLKKHKPLWLIDASAYVKEYESHIHGEWSDSDWKALWAFAREAGGEEGELLALYIEKVTRVPLS